jgi:hypothetical protein
LISFILNIKKDFDYYARGITIMIRSAITFFINFRIPRGNFMFILPQITYGNMAHFYGYNKNEIFAGYWDT